MEELNNNDTVHPWLLATLGIVIIMGVVFFGWTYIWKDNSTTAPLIMVTPKATPKVSPTTTTVLPSPKSTTSPVAGEWKTYTNDQTRLSFNYPADWFASYKPYEFTIADQEACLTTTDPSKDCQIINIFYAISGSGTMRNQKIEAELAKNSAYIQDSIISGAVKVNTYWSSAKDDFQVYFDGSRYNATTKTSQEILKQILATVKIQPIAQ